MTTEDNTLIPLPFTVVASSASPGCEATKLEQYDEDGDGWQSEMGCIFPQLLTLKLNDKSAIIDVIEILCHETKIPTKVDIDLGVSSDASTFEACKSISQLGYIVFLSGDGESRELKSIPIGREANFVRFTIHGSQEGPHNPNKQVGFAAIRVLSSQGKSETDASAPIGSDIEVLNKGARSAASNSLPLAIKNELDPKIAASVDRLERLKKESAAAEDFDTAARIKQELGQVYALLIAFKESENQMKQAALEEDYVEASRLKAERDGRRNDARAALTEVEQQFAVNVNADNAANLSISTIKDRSFVSERSLHDKEVDGEHSFHSDEEESYSSGAGKETSSEDNSSSPRSGGSANNDHPLAGVDGAEELPSPEDITLSTDLVHKVESLFGSYRAKCLFSKNWALREAALAKMTLMIPEICSAELEGDTIFSIIASSMIQDKNVQVNLSSLILLDEVLLQLETTSQSISMTPQLTRILVDLFSKMADNSKKVADSAEISLLALAHSSSVDVSYVSMLATKRVRSKEAKGGRTVRARLQFLENLSAEFGVDVAWKKIIDFAKTSKAFDHRDGSVRDAAKSLVMTLAMIHGNEVFKSLEGDLTERQLRELQLGLQMVQ